MPNHPKKTLILNILDILRRYSDENHRLSQKDIVDILRTEYDMTVERKVIRRNILDLMDCGYEIEYSESVRMVPNKESGELEDVVLQFDRALVEPVFDKFGEDVPMMPVNDDTLAATVHVQISPTFFGWLAQFGGRMKVLSPDNVVAQYKKHIAGITKDNS